MASRHEREAGLLGRRGWDRLFFQGDIRRGRMPLFPFMAGRHDSFFIGLTEGQTRMALPHGARALLTAVIPLSEALLEGLHVGAHTPHAVGNTGAKGL